jgi:micrococcal nuclease
MLRLLICCLLGFAGFVAATSMSAGAGLGAAASPVAKGSGAAGAVVVEVVDGDTLVGRFAGGKRVRIRILGIDSPEMRPRERCAVQATKAVRRLALGRSVTLVGDRTQAKRDRFKRLLAYVTLRGGSDLGRRVVSIGYAKVYVFGGRSFLRAGTYRAAERNARSRRLGIWGDCSSGTVPRPAPPKPPTTATPTTTSGPFVPTVPTTTGTTATSPTTTGTTTTTPLSPPTTNVTYKTGLQLDVYRPAALTGRPALVLVHGGGWSGGDKAGSNQIDTAQRYAKRGFVVFSINYSLNPSRNRTPNYRQPPIDDVGDAVEWVRANGALYGADRTKVALLGQSAGGHLALMAALTKTGNEKPDAVLCWSAPTRLENFDFTPAAGSRQDLVADYIGVDDLTDPAFDTFSPYYQTLTAAPPIRLVHSEDEGDNPYGVPVSNADDMHAALLRAGRDSTKVIRAGDVHAEFLDDTDLATDWLQIKLSVT